MKKLALLVVVGWSMNGWAAHYGVAGCGLGSIVFGKDSQIIAATLNGTGVQTFGITTGTSNCVDENTAKNAELFIENNRQALANDMARGQGETLASLSQVLGCTAPASFSSALQSNYSEVFTTADRKASAVRDSIYQVILQDSVLSQTCKI